MLIKTNKKKAIFSSLKDVKKFKLDITPRYLKETIVSDEEIESISNVTTHQLLVKLPIDKVSSVTHNVKFLEGFACKDFKSLRTRSGMLRGFAENDKQSLNYAILNKEALAREDFKRKTENANLVKVFNLDVALKLFSDINIRDIKNNKKDRAKMFGYKEIVDVSEVSNIAKNNLKNFNRLDLQGISLSANNHMTKEVGDFNKFENNHKKELSKKVISKINFKKLFNGYINAGIDPAKIISKSFYSGQSLDAMMKGRLQKNFALKNSVENFANKFHEIIENSLPQSSSRYTIKRNKIPKIHDTIEIKFNIGSHFLEKTKSNIFDIVVFAMDAEKRIIDYHVINIVLDNLKKRNNLIEKCESVLENKHAFSCRRLLNNRLAINISNNSNFDARYTLFKSEVKQQKKKNNYFITEDNSLDISKKQNIYALSNNSSYQISDYSSYFYRLKLSHNDFEFDNTFFQSIPYVRKASQSLGSFVNLFCESDPFDQKKKSIRITVKDVPNGVIGVNVVKRNVTKKEKHYRIIKNLNQEDFKTQDDKNLLSLSLKDQKTTFINRKASFELESQSYTFVDEDVEVGDTYEYKALLYDNNCVTFHSSNSYLIEYEKRMKLISVYVKRNSHNNSLNEIQSIDEKFNIGLGLGLRIKEDAFDQLFSSLDRNAYESFANEFNELKESLKKSVSCIVNLINNTTGEKTKIGVYNNLRYSNSEKTSEINLSVEVDNPFNEYTIEVIPRISTLSQVIENILNKLSELPSLQKSLPISSFSRNLMAIKNQDLNQSKLSKLSEKTIQKYTSKSIKLFGLILDPVTRFNQEQDDFYFEGSTGDNYYLKVYTPKTLNVASKLSFKNYLDLSYPTLNSPANNKVYKKLGILAMSTDSVSHAISFYGIYAKINGVIKFLGMISPNDFGKQYYNFAIDLEESIGIADIYSVSVLKNGDISVPNLVTSLLCTNKLVKAI
jgi:hypothetical protein